MGAPALESLADLEPIDVADLAGTTAGVDAFNWLYRYMEATVRTTDPAAYTTVDGTAVPNLIGIVRGLSKCFEHRIFPVFVFDGEPVPLKRDRLASRRAARRRARKRAEEARDRGDARDAARYSARALHMTDPIRRSTDELLGLLDLPSFTAPSEAEAQVAHLAREGSVDYGVTNDFDALLYATPITIREFAADGRAERMDFQATLDRHGITWPQLLDVAILCGTDYNDGIPGMGPETALAAIQEVDDLEAVLADHGVTIDDADRIRDLFLHPTVSEAFDVDPTCDPDLDAAWTYLVEEWEIPAGAIEADFRVIEANRSAWR